MGKHEKVPGVGAYGGPAGGWGALQAVARALRAQMALNRETRALRRVNQPDGFDCPGCAWPDPRHASSFEFCENGAKAVAWEATRKRADPEFFAAHTVAELWNWSDYALEDARPPDASDALRRGHATATCRSPGTSVRTHRRTSCARSPDPNMAEFYTSGRTSNEAAFLYQLFAREFGTNNFPDCSNMCHEATSVGLPESIGVGKGTVTLEDFDHADAIFCIGHNPGTNHPRMLATLREASKRGGTIVVFNPLRERGLERFAGPQDPVEMLTLDRATPIASVYHQVQGRRRRRGAEGHDEGAAGARRARIGAAARRARPRLHRRAHDRLRGAGRRHRRARTGRRSSAARADARARSKHAPRSTPAPSASSSATAWASRSTATARQTCSRSPTCCCCAATSAAGRRHLPGARPHQRAGRPHRRHHRDSQRRASSTARERRSASSRRASRATTRSRPSRRSAKGTRKALVCLGGNLAGRDVRPAR